MLNQVVIIGRLVEKPIVEENENGRKLSEITLAVPRSFKNVDGIYETDFIKCILWSCIAENTAEYCDKGDLISVKAKSKEEAYEIVSKQYKDGEIVLDYNDFSYYEIDVMTENTVESEE